jgi:hypothetical protein
MNRATLVALCIATLVTSAAAIGIGSASEPAKAPALARAEYVAAVERVDASRTAALGACAAQRGLARDACESQAEAAAALAKAELDTRYRRTPQAARREQRARIEVRYQAARARCTALGGYDRDRCLIDAHAVLGLALLESQAPYAMRVRAAR